MIIINNKRRKMEKRLNKLKLSSQLIILFIYCTWYLSRNIYLDRIKKKADWIIKIKVNIRYRHFMISRSRLETSTAQRLSFFFFSIKRNNAAGHKPLPINPRELWRKPVARISGISFCSNKGILNFIAIFAFI